MLTFRAKLDGKKISSFEGKEVCKLQFMQRDAKGTLSLMEIKVPEGMDHTKFEENKLVEVPVACSAFNDNVYFRIVEMGSSHTEPQSK